MCKQNKCVTVLIAIFTRQTRKLNKCRISFKKNAKNQRYSSMVHGSVKSDYNVMSLNQRTHHSVFSFTSVHTTRYLVFCSFSLLQMIIPKNPCLVYDTKGTLKISSRWLHSFGLNMNQSLSVSTSSFIHQYMITLQKKM